MQSPPTTTRSRARAIGLRRGLDSAGILLSALCAVHCLAGVVLVVMLGLGGTMLGTALADPRIHEYGLMAAVLVGAAGLGTGFARHRRRDILARGLCGLALMAAGLLAASSRAVLTEISIITFKGAVAAAGSAETCSAPGPAAGEVVAPSSLVPFRQCRLGSAPASPLVEARAPAAGPADRQPCFPAAVPAAVFSSMPQRLPEGHSTCLPAITMVAADESLY